MGRQEQGKNERFLNVVKECASKLRRAKTYAERDEEDRKDGIINSISDKSFSKLVNELRKNKIYTHMGVLQHIIDQNMDNIIVRETKNEARYTSSKNLFDQDQSFRALVAKNLTESSKLPIYKRMSDIQIKALKRCSTIDYMDFEDENGNH